ncbi:hypothetical protein ANN_14379 [Periplaneta americana]|uniref:Uncharacterized protein n=1 Tax=Periplaneta americana TaxID=6978 RepID=A0ABQ8SW50_PERAM|nr:hypothetical protein ANN_14379 [Periplaneta americana]
MSPGSDTESYPAFARIRLRENSGKNLNQVTCPDRESNPGHLLSRPDALAVTPQVWTVCIKSKKKKKKKKKQHHNVRIVAAVNLQITRDINNPIESRDIKNRKPFQMKEMNNVFGNKLHLRVRITAAIIAMTKDMLLRIWNELDYKTDVWKPFSKSTWFTVILTKDTFSSVRYFDG